MHTNVSTRPINIQSISINTLNFNMDLLVFLFFMGFSLSSASHKVLDSEDFEVHLDQAGDKIVVAAFTTPWCGPCVLGLKAMEKLEAEFTNVVFLRIDSDENESIATGIDIEALPTFAIFQKSKFIDKEIGSTESLLREFIQRNINKHGNH